MEDVDGESSEWLGFNEAVDRVLDEMKEEHMKNTVVFPMLNNDQFIEQLKKDYINKEQIKISFDESARSKMKGPESLKAGMYGKYPSKVAKQAAKEVILAQVSRQGKYQLLKKAIIDVQNKSQEMDKTHTILKNQNKILRKELEKLQIRDEYRGSVEEANKELKDMVANLTEENRNLKREIERLRDQVDELKGCKDIPLVQNSIIESEEYE
ncbi:uncharacterized protein LOC100372217 [Saccoglossus kowalevskii]|uniref:Golgin subfamily A member 5-like n=1 Tax=Saccoglossus kowalevskii TaxID=10224 RepID=A0ABM0GPF0_SACKO|nr:PREDICTED: golgin subfamily A member 5-like [Saccoglossus kowalevskii]